MEELRTMDYEVTDRVARITLNRPERGNGITLDMPRELSACVERANLDTRFEILLARIARVPANQLIMHKLLLNQVTHAQGLAASQLLGTIFDGVARHTEEGYAFQQKSQREGFKAAVRERDEPFGDAGRSTFKG